MEQHGRDDLPVPHTAAADGRGAHQTHREDSQHPPSPLWAQADPLHQQPGAQHQDGQLRQQQPEGSGGGFWQNAAWSGGSMRDIGSMFTVYWSQMVKDGLASHGECTMARSAGQPWFNRWKTVCC